MEPSSNGNEPIPQRSSADRPPRAPGSGPVATDLEDAPIIDLSSSPLNVTSMSGGQLREEYLQHQVVLRLMGPLSLRKGEFVTLRWENDAGLHETILSKMPIDMVLQDGEQRSFKFKASYDPERRQDGSFKRNVKVITGKRVLEEQAGNEG